MKRKTRIRLIALAGIVVVLAISSAVIFWAYHRPPVQTVATMDQIKEVVASLKQSKGYKDGGPYLADFETGRVVFDPKTLDRASYRNYTVNSRLTVDFVDSLTPAQVNAMGAKGVLSFTSLRPDQQRYLRLFYKYAGGGEVKESDFPRSALVVVHEPGYMFLDWRVMQAGKVIANRPVMLVDLSDEVISWEKTYRPD